MQLFPHNRLSSLFSSTPPGFCHLESRKSLFYHTEAGSPDLFSWSALTKWPPRNLLWQNRTIARLRKSKLSCVGGLDRTLDSIATSQRTSRTHPLMTWKGVNGCPFPFFGTKYGAPQGDSLINWGHVRQDLRVGVCFCLVGESAGNRSYMVLQITEKHRVAFTGFALKLPTHTYCNLVWVLFKS